MKTISKRELNHQTAQVLAAIQAGEAVLVTERGVPRWRIEAVDASADPVERLRAQGRIRPASANHPPWPKGRTPTTDRRPPGRTSGRVGNGAAVRVGVGGCRSI